ncbi:class I SAM-dependent methyltransferase [Agarivorans gilvus]|uniref:Methyltransferase type 11 domain-containing protein n=1 Tax=Agarivorans gilvus TaxID=680279 RepID=A0ABQ1I4H6_9ALTE|nr:class I SAM-dependent methyltransferase [Agarivorans gilvus]GGB10514.1 hypothetical protein GCM10007414_24850 [Agarivorans gilvus]
MNKANENETLEANKIIHTALVTSGAYQKSPHFKPENQKKVRQIIKSLSKDLGNESKLIDFGCGTGFILNLSKDLFSELHGVDITPEMINRVDTSSGNIILNISKAEKTPYKNNEFDMATAYSFMDHLSSPNVFLKEVHRVLKPGGIFYSDLNPNRHFIQSLKMEDKNKKTNSPLINREIKAAIHNGEHYHELYGVSPESLEKAEPIKTINHGFCPEEIRKTAEKIGFSECNITYDWFIDQGRILNNEPEGNSDIIENYLKSVLPLSSHLFKYIRIIMKK